MKHLGRWNCGECQRQLSKVMNTKLRWMRENIFSEKESQEISQNLSNDFSFLHLSFGFYRHPVFKPTSGSFFYLYFANFVQLVLWASWQPSIYRRSVLMVVFLFWSEVSPIMQVWFIWMFCMMKMNKYKLEKKISYAIPCA